MSNINAEFESRCDIILAFSREFLPAIGEITKYLWQFGYVVDHVKSYFNGHYNDNNDDRLQFTVKKITE